MIHMLNVNTGEEVIREMNDEEYAQLLVDKAEIEAEQIKQLEADAKKAAKVEAKKQALAALGLSQEIINLLAE
jgi:hypothetical protein